MLLGGKDSGDDGVGVDVGVVGSREPGGTSAVETRLSATGSLKQRWVCRGVLTTENFSGR